MKIYRNSLLAKLHILITQNSVDKEALYSAYNVESAKNLSNDQLKDCINHIEGKTPSQTKTVPDTDIKKLRSEVLALLTWSPRATNKRKQGLGLPNDWAVLNPFIAQHAGRDLTSLTIADLNRFKLKLHAMKKSGWFYKQSEPDPIPTTAVSQVKITPKSTPIFIGQMQSQTLS